MLPHRGPHDGVSGSVDEGRCRFWSLLGRDGVGSDPPIDVDPFVAHPELVVPWRSSQVLQEFLAGVEGDDAGSFTVSLDYGLAINQSKTCLLYTSPSPRDRQKSRMPSSA